MLETIFLVENVDTVQQIVRMALEDRDYRVLNASDGRTAITLAEIASGRSTSH